MITRKRIWTILSLVVLTFIIVGIVDILMIAGIAFSDTVRSNLGVKISDPIGTKIRTEGVPYSPFKLLANAPDLALSPINYKRLHLDVDSGRVAAAYDVYLRKDHSLFMLAEQNMGADMAQKLSNEVLGAVSVSGKLLKFERIETSISDTDERAHIFVTAAPFSLTNETYEIKIHAKQLNLPLSFDKKEILVSTKGVSVQSGWPFFVPISKSPENTHYVLPAHADETQFSVHVTNPVTDPDGPVRDTLGQTLQKQVEIPGLGNFIFGCLEAIPFILVMVWGRRYTAEIPNVDSMQNVLKIYLIFHFSYFFFYSVNYLIEDWQSPFMSALSFFERRTLPLFGTSNYRNTTYILLPLMAVFIYVWPTFARTHGDAEQLRRERWRERGTQILALIFFVGLLAWAAYALLPKLQTLRTQPGNLTVGEYYQLFFAVLVFAIYVLILLLGRTIGHPIRSGFSLCLFSVVIVLMAFDLIYIFAANSDYKYLQIANGVLSGAIFATAAVVITWAFAVLCYRAVTAKSLHDDWKVWGTKNRTILVVVLLAVAFSTRSWAWPMRYWPLWSLAWELKDLAFLIIVWFLGSFLRKASADYDWLKLPESAREAGILLALCLFYSPTTRWNYIPVSFIVGFFLLKYWLLPKTPFDLSSLSEVRSQLNKFIKRSIEFNDAHRTLSALKKDLLSKLGKGEIEPKEYSEKLLPQVDTVEKCREDLMVQDRFAKDHVLALGPGTSAWQNGLRTAAFSIIFSIPWLVFYLRDMVQARVTTESYLILDLLNAILYFVIAWLSYGFIFGFFYPYIRGKNGMQKAVVLFLTIVLPELVWTALAQTSEGNWVSFGFWNLQVFIHTMLLGMVAGDYSILRSNGFTWDHLMDFYRLRSLSAWASSILLAIAAAAGTLITSGATEVLASALKYVGVVPENVDLPKK